MTVNIKWVYVVIIFFAIHFFILFEQFEIFTNQNESIGIKSEWHIL